MAAVTDRAREKTPALPGRAQGRPGETAHEASLWQDFLAL